MLRVPARDARLSPAERFALDLLIDLSRVIPADDIAEAVSIEVVDQEEGSADLRLGQGDDWHIQPQGDSVLVPRRTLSLVVDVAGAAVEQASSEADRHGRVPSDVNPLVAAGVEREPIICFAAAALRRAVLGAAGRGPVRLAVPWPEGRRWAAAITHDLDVVDYWPAFTLLRLLELGRKARVGLAANVMRSAMGAIGRDPVVRSIENVLAQEAARDVVSTWFVLCGTPNLATMRAGDLTYLPEGNRASGIMKMVAAGEHEIGLHGSFRTMDQPEQFALQRTRLERLVGNRVLGVRQHFMRMRPGQTHSEMAQVGFAYDATYGFPDRNGFRLGVADIVSGWDAGGGRASDVDEVPLIWMDRAQSKYQGVEDPAAWIEDARDLLKSCRAVEGAWVGLWHPNLTPALGYPGTDKTFGSLLDVVLSGSPFVSTLADLSAWRRARRSLRATELRRDGTLEVELASSTQYPVQIEDADGRVIQTVDPATTTKPL